MEATVGDKASLFILLVLIALCVCVFHSVINNFFGEVTFNKISGY